MSRGRWPTASTRLVALLGWPARYSLSPDIHGAAFDAMDLDLAYVVLPCRTADLPTVVAALAACDAVGANVTVPHKSAVVAHCDTLTDEARVVGAVNTLVFDADGVHGDNTDVSGILDDWQRSLGERALTRIVVFGTGGAARAAVVAGARRGARVDVVGRRIEVARDLAGLASTCGASAAEAHALTSSGDAAIDDVIAAADVVVNATPLGMSGESLPGAFLGLSPGQVAHDLVYLPRDTPFLRAAAARGADTLGGIGMLVGQAAASLEQWTGRTAPVDVMRTAADAALAAAEGRA